MRKFILLISTVAGMLGSMSQARADAVVTDGRFMNVYVYPNPNQETWEEHLKKLPASLKPTDWEKFTRRSIDGFTASLMSPGWPSYFGALYQYGGINPPRFFGSYVASQKCVDAAMRDLHNGVLEATTLRSLANCHSDGMDPPPQINIIISPDIKVGPPPGFPTDAANGPDMCAMTGQHPIAYHYWGLNVPNFTVLPTCRGCAPDFNGFTSTLTHEIVELLSDPAQLGHGGAGGKELGDQCEGNDYTWKGFNVQRYRSDNDNDCWPLPFPAMSTTTTWVLAEGSPTIRFTGDVHVLTLKVPERRLTTDARATEVQIWIQTGGDDLRAGNNASDNADVTLTFAGGNTVTQNINGGREWGNGQTHIARLTLPATAPRVQDIEGVTITTHFGGGIGGDNWNVDKVALMIGFPTGSKTSEPAPIIIHEWLDKSDGPLIRFTGSIHDLVENVPSADTGIAVSALDLIISTGNDDLRGGGNAGDNCDVTIELTNGKSITVNNANNGSNWKNWTDHTVGIPIPKAGIRGGEVTSVKLHSGFGGGIGGDNWNVQRIQLRATLSPDIRRYDTVWRPGTTAETQLYGMSFDQYQKNYDDLWKKGERIYRLNTYIENGQRRYDAVWRPGATAETQLYGMSFDQYQQHYDDLWKKGERVYLLNTYIENGQRRYDAVWRPGTTAETQLYGMSFDQYQKQYNDLWKKGERIYLLNTYVQNGQRQYDAVWRPDTTAETQLYGMSFDQYQQHYDDLWKKGERVYLVNTYIENGQRRYDAVWRPGTTAETQLYGMSFDQYQKQYNDLWKKGERIYLLNTYEIGP